MPTYGASYGASYGTPTASYAMPTASYAMPTASYGTGYSMPMSMPTQSYGGYGGYGAPALDEKVVETMLAAEKDRALQVMSTQYTQQYTQQKLAIEQAYKQQHNQLEMAKTQRDMAIH